MTRIMEWPRDWHAEVASGSFTLSSKNLMSQNPFTRRLSVSGPINQMFMVKLQLTTQVYETWLEMEGFFAEASGSASIIRMADFARLEPYWNKITSGTTSLWTSGSPAVTSHWSDGTGWVGGLLPPSVVVVEAAEKGDTSVIIGGFTGFESTTGVLARGDDIEFRRNGVYDETPSLHRIVRSANTNSSGETRVEFRPALRKAVAAGDTVVLSYPMGNFRLANDDQAIVTRVAPDFGQLSIDLVEAIL